MLRRGVGIGSSIAGRTLEAEIGRGGMGVVYKAHNDRLDRTEAVKVITDDLAKDRSFRDRFLREASITVAVEHPHVIPVYDADEAAGGILFIAMRYVEDGHTMARLISQRQRLEPQVAANLTSAIASALDAAHARDLVHRDVKPTNVLIVGDRSPHAYLTDFGLSKRISSHTALSDAGSVIGTVDYMSPEQAQGLPVDLRTDVYALGVALFEALTGTVPYLGDTSASRLLAKIQDPPPMVTQIASGIPPEFDTVVAKALARDPEHRYASAGELGRAAMAAVGRGVVDLRTSSEIGVGSIVADCLIEEVAGEGGMAIVYRANQQALDRTVALKVMSPGLAEQSEFRVRFEREQKMAAALDHPGIVPVHWAGEAHGRLFIVMKFVEGETLRERLARGGRLDPELAVELLEQVAGALGAAHERGLVHRDIKPGNVLLEAGTGRVYLTDFGLAKPVDDDITEPSDKVMGTVRYMAPERHRGGGDEVLGDIYALGCVLWDMLGGMERPRLDAMSDVSPALAQVVARAVDVDPEKRHSSALELAQDARRALEQGAAAGPAHPGTPTPPPRESDVRRPRANADVSSELTEHVLRICDGILRTGIAGEARSQLEDVRAQLVAPLQMAVVGRPDSGRTGLINALLGRQLTKDRGYGDIASHISFVHGSPERVVGRTAAGATVEVGLAEDGGLPDEILNPPEPFADLEVRLTVDALRTLSLSIGATAEQAGDRADAFLLTVAADAIADIPTLLEDLSRGVPGRGISAINAGIVVTKADVAGTAILESGLDATVERALQPLIADADRLNARLAEIGGTDVPIGEDVALIAELARSSGGTRTNMLATEQSFREGAASLSEGEATHLLDRYGLEGLRAAFELADAGQLSGVELRRRLREVSGMLQLRRKIYGFHLRSDAIKAGRALEQLEELAYRWPELDGLLDQVQQVELEPDMHLLGLIDAYERCVLSGVEVPKELLDRLEQLIVGRTEAERFGVEDGSSVEEVRSAMDDGFRAWKIFQQSAGASPKARRVAVKVSRSYEHYKREGESATR